MKLIPSSRPNWEIQIVSYSGFNNDPLENSYLVVFTKNEFGLNCGPTEPTTFVNTTIDCKFTRLIEIYMTAYNTSILNIIVPEY